VNEGKGYREATRLFVARDRKSLVAGGRSIKEAGKA